MFLRTEEPENWREKRYEVEVQDREGPLEEEVTCTGICPKTKGYFNFRGENT